MTSIGFDANHRLSVSSQDVGTFHAARNSEEVVSLYMSPLGSVHTRDHSQDESTGPMSRRMMR